jgi:hypothetical protein
MTLLSPSASAARLMKVSTMRSFASSPRFRLAALGVLLTGLTGPAAADTPRPAADAPLQAAPGVTALSGRVMSVEGEPLVNVALRDGTVGTRTDAQGRFLLTRVPPGLSVLTIDGRHASGDGKTDYGLFEIRVTAAAGGTTVLPYTSYLPKIDHAHDVTIPSPTTAEVVVTSAVLPGLELHIPAGSVLTDTDGKKVTRIGITPFPLDRTPFPMPGHLEVPVHFTVQPGGATVTGIDGQPRGIRVYYPNLTHQMPQARANLYEYDPFRNGWTQYGAGTVSADGRQIIPDAASQLSDLTGAM